MNGFGEKAYLKLRKNIEKSREIEVHRFLYALGIKEIGRSASKDILKYFDNDLLKVMEAITEKIVKINGVGTVMANNLVEYFEKNKEMVLELMKEFNFIKPVAKTSSLSGLTFVITGKLHLYANRDALKNEIENNGGKVSSSVSSKTDYLINNDIHSASGKNKKAKELGIEILTEDEFEKKF